MENIEELNKIREQILASNKEYEEHQKKLTDQASMFFDEFNKIRFIEDIKERQTAWEVLLQKYPSAPLPPQTLLES